MQIPKGSIEFIMGRVHVGKSDEYVRELMLEKIGAPERAKQNGWTAAKIRAAQDYAIKVHHANQNLYHSVMTGRF